MTRVLNHLIRNAMDHGLEKPETRRKIGKAGRGIISLSVKALPKGLVLNFKDDGAGLNLGLIKQMGVAKKLIAPDETEPKKIADLIFNDGLSTAQSVTEISGRGVGMSAVRAYLEDAGCSLNIRFLGDAGFDSPVPVEFALSLDSSLYKASEVNSG